MILVDANVWIDVIQDDLTWGAWSAKELARARNRDEVAINPIIAAEVSLAFASPDDLNRYLSASLVQRLPLPYAAAFSAALAQTSLIGQPRPRRADAAPRAAAPTDLADATVPLPAQPMP